MGNRHEIVRFEEPQVEIIATTERDPIRAAGLLIFTKRTRLEMSAAGLEATIELCRQDPQWMHDELKYMSQTIRSSWEFLDYTFMVSNVSRAGAQQITRTRHASFAMQSQRVTNMSNATFHLPETMEPRARGTYRHILSKAMEGYDELTDPDDPQASLEDARGVLPMNTHCNIVAKYNLRTLADLLVVRTSPRAQSEYRRVAELMRAKLVEMHPWVEIFLQPKNKMAGEMLLALGRKAEERGDKMEAMYIAKIRDMIAAG